MAKKQDKLGTTDKTNEQGQAQRKSQAAAGKAKAQETVAREKGKKAGARSHTKGEKEDPAKGINRLPQWLHQEKGLSDTLAGGLVVVVSGAVIMLLVFILTKIWPAGS